MTLLNFREKMYPLFEKAEAKLSERYFADQYLVENNILYYQSEVDVKRLVVPASCRPLVLHVAHTVPWAGDLGRQKTYLRLGSRFFWPTMYTDTLDYCRTCSVCQKTSIVHRSEKAPLCPLPVIQFNSILFI